MVRGFTCYYRGMLIARYLVLIVVAVFVISGFGAGIHYWNHQEKSITAAAGTYKTPEESDAFVRFVMEGYDIIQANYWQKAEDKDMSALFLASVQKAASSSATLSSNDRAGVAKLVSQVVENTAEVDRVKTAETILQVALFNMAPTGRNQLLSTAARDELNNTVNNVHPNNDLYKNLGVENGASAETVQKAFDEKKEELQASSSPAAAEELKKVSYAKEVLTDTDAKANYDQSRVEPTVFSHLVNPSTLYVYITSMAPATEAEFESIAKKEIKEGVQSMILDLRGNIGGDLTTAQTFLGLFQGANQYGFDFFNRGAYEDQRTIGMGKLAELLKIREIAILTDGMTQSTAEVITAAMKKLHLAYSVGGKTRGWGSIEQIIPMQTVIDPNNTHTMLLVVRLTVRDDGQPIEGQGVVPDFDVSNPDWQGHLSEKFFSKDLIAAIKRTISVPPQK